MNKTELNQQEAVRLLRLLLNDESENRLNLGKDLHSQKHHLNFLRYNLSVIEKSRKSRTYPRIINEQKQMINDCQAGLSALQKKMYSVTLIFSGILHGIKQYIVDYPKEHPVRVELDFQNAQNADLGKIHDVNIYKSCTEIIDYMFMSGCKTLEINIGLKAGDLEVEITGRSTKPVTQDAGLIKKVDLIKARLLLCDAVTGPETNWTDKFSIIFLAALSRG